jgi:predicted dehydrogenase
VIDDIALDPVRVGVIGLGYWGPNIARALQELPEASLTHVCDLVPDALARVGRRYPAVTLTTEVEEVLADPDVEAVAIATPVRSHHGLVSAALEAGKHVFVEKPLAASLAEAVELADLAASRGLVLMPGHTFLYSPPVNAVRELIDGGALGDVYFVSMSRVNLGLHQRDVSVAWDLGPHDFSILRYWLGESPSHVTALSRSCVLPGTADVAFINMEFPSQTIAHVELSWLAPSKLRRTTIVGSDSMVVYDDTSNEPVRIFDAGVEPPAPETFGEYRLTYRSGDIVSPRITAAEPLSLEMADFCAAIRTGSEPRSNVEVGIEVVRTIEAVDASLASAGRVSVTGADSLLATGD